MRKNIIDTLQVVMAILITGSTAYAMHPTTEPTPEVVPVALETPKEPAQEPPKAIKPKKAVRWQDNPNNCTDKQWIAKEAPFKCINKKLVEKSAPSVVTSSPTASVAGNETIAWDFFISKGFTRNQTAGIMGNLQQEHGFKTADVGGGLGIAQWIGGRRTNLMARANYLDINVQLQFLLDELNGPESAAGAAIRAATSVEWATIAFQDKFERCGVCMQDQRIRYAYDIMSRH